MFFIVFDHANACARFGWSKYTTYKIYISCKMLLHGWSLSQQQSPTFFMWAVLVDCLFFDHLRSIFHHLIHFFNINNNGRWRHSKKVDSNLLLFLESQFQSIDTTKENEILYKSSPGFEPTTFLIHDLSIDDLDRSTTVGRQQSYTLLRPKQKNVICLNIVHI